MASSGVEGGSSLTVSDDQEGYFQKQIAESFESYFHNFTQQEIDNDKYEAIEYLTALEHSAPNPPRIHQSSTNNEYHNIENYISKYLIDRTAMENNNCMRDIFYRSLQTPDKYIVLMAANEEEHIYEVVPWKRIIVTSEQCIGSEIKNNIMFMASLYRKQWYDIAKYVLNVSRNIYVPLPENVFICAYGNSYTYRIYLSKDRVHRLMGGTYDVRRYDEYNCTCIGIYKVCRECYESHVYSQFLSSVIYNITNFTHLPLVTYETCCNTFDSFARFTYVIGRGYMIDGKPDYTESNMFCNYCEKSLIGNIEIVHDVTHKITGCISGSNNKLRYADNEFRWKINY